MWIQILKPNKSPKQRLLEKIQERRDRYKIKK